ncbi:MAG: undecaprenyldiphospho-muramoylpentapeptide beta-N-acetylglucosaminyltransferase [Clostridia bacterium]
MKILAAGGGSGGHVNPAIAMANMLRAKYPDAQILFVGSRKGLENDLVPKEGYRLVRIPVKGFSRKGFLTRILPYLVLAVGMIKSFFVVAFFRPDMAYGTGGFAAGPVLFWTSFFKIPTLIHEANVLPGITNMMLSPRASITAISFEESRDKFVKAKRIELTGNPVRESLLKADRNESRTNLGLAGDEKLVVAMGGSQGAGPINDAVCDMLMNFYKEGEFRLVFAPGKRHFDEVSQKVTKKFKGVDIRPYIYDADIVYSAADLIINRAGAITMAEITALGIPSILVPSPYVAENHQENNARALEARGACKVLVDSELSGRVLYDAIMGILNDDQWLDSMAKASSASGTRDATEKLAGLFDELLEGVV